MVVFHKVLAETGDVLERVIDKGIVIDTVGRLQLMGIDLLSVQPKVMTISIETYLREVKSFGVSVVPLKRGAVSKAKLLRWGRVRPKHDVS